MARSAHRTLDPLRTWVTTLQERTHHNKATCALPNKLARICYAVLRDHAPYGENTIRARKLDRASFVTAV